eukprot:GHVR01095320.1.p1 GENE.GHVR01095320.1~~GHVR01095320.1.p1  ORF type:complete len:223 (+),score=36.94 GHVR01095320.1:100-768(+)
MVTNVKHIASYIYIRYISIQNNLPLNFRVLTSGEPSSDDIDINPLLILSPIQEIKYINELKPQESHYISRQRALLYHMKLHDHINGQLTDKYNHFNDYSDEFYEKNTKTNVKFTGKEFEVKLLKIVRKCAGYINNVNTYNHKYFYMYYKYLTDLYELDDDEYFYKSLIFLLYGTQDQIKYIYDNGFFNFYYQREANNFATEKMYKKKSIFGLKKKKKKNRWI